MIDVPFREAVVFNIKITDLAKKLIHAKHAQRDIDFVNESAEDLLKSKGYEIPDKNSLEYRQLCHEIFKAEAFIFDIKNKRNQGDYSGEMETALSSTPSTVAHTSIPTEQPKGPSIGSLKDKWFLENKKADAWKPRSLEAYTGYFTIFFQILEEGTPIDSITMRQSDISRIPF